MTEDDRQPEARRSWQRLGVLSDSTVFAAQQALDGRRRGLRAVLPFAGPAFIVSVAYIDPGNFATNIQAGSFYGYRLLWVLVFANLSAMLFQSLSAKLGIATGRNLAEMSRDHFPQPVALGMWLVSEVAAMATDLAELLGAALALNLMFHLPLFIGAMLTAIATYGILSLGRHGFRPIEALIGTLVGVMAVSYILETFFARPDWGLVLQGATVPWLGSSGAELLAVGLIGATVMPHVIYVHSGLTQDRVVARSAKDRRKILRYSNIDVGVALGLAGLINLAMMYMAAATFHPDHPNVASIATASLTSLRSSVAPRRPSSSSRSLRQACRRPLLAPSPVRSSCKAFSSSPYRCGSASRDDGAFARRDRLGVDVTHALVFSQVVLSLVLPVPLIRLC